MANIILGSLRMLVEKTTPQPQPPWWLILPILALIVVIVIWALNRNARPSDAPHVEHYEPAEALPVAHVPSDRATEPVALGAEMPVEQVRSERGIEPAARSVEAPVEQVRSERSVEPVILPDDLKLIEGIGPKIAGLLNEAGISTFAQLAAASVDDLRLLLEKAGLQHIADPATWPEQAALAARGDLQALQTLQDSLKGGRK